MSARFEAAGRVAIVGYAHSAITRSEEVGLGPLTMRTTLEAIADAGLTLEDIDGFTTGALFPSESRLSLPIGW